MKTRHGSGCQKVRKSPRDMPIIFQHPVVFEPETKDRQDMTLCLPQEPFLPVFYLELQETVGSRLGEAIYEHIE